MKKSEQNFALILLLSIVGLYCQKNENPVSPEPLPSFLYGQVTDLQGKPLDSVGVHYVFSTVTSNLLKESKTCPSTTIVFSIPQRARVSLKIFRWYTQEFIATLVDTIKDAGTYSVVFNGAILTNGCYIYRLTIDSTVTEKHMWLLNTDISTLINATPLTVSNSTGQFSLPLGIFGVGMQTLATGSSPSQIDTVYISHIIQIVLYRSGYRTSTQTLTIDTSKGMQQTFKLEK